MNQEVILEIINNYLPSVVAIVVAICTMVTAVQKMKKNGLEQNILNRKILQRLNDTEKENQELKKAIVQLAAAKEKIMLPEEKRSKHGSK